MCFPREGGGLEVVGFEKIPAFEGKAMKISPLPNGRLR